MKRALLALALSGCASTTPLRLPAPTVATPTVLSVAGAELAPIDAEHAGVDPSALARLDAEAIATHSDALVLLKDGRVLWHRRYTAEANQPIETMSITKSVSAIAVAMCLEDGHIGSLDEPLYRWFPEWRQGKKQQITLRNLLTHSSGLQDTDDTSEIWRSPDFVQLALAAELDSPPGARFHYNNKAANLVAEVVHRACGERIDQLLARRLFAPLGIEHYQWLRDPAGHALVQSGLKLEALDLAKIGEMLRLRGRYATHELLDPTSLDALLAPSPRQRLHGLFFWLLESGHGFAGRGYLGQHLVVLPERGVVAVRLRHWTASARSGRDDFDDFESKVLRLFAPVSMQ